MVLDCAPSRKCTHGTPPGRIPLQRVAASLTALRATATWLSAVRCLPCALPGPGPTLSSMPPDRPGIPKRPEYPQLAVQWAPEPSVHLGAGTRIGGGSGVPPKPTLLKPRPGADISATPELMIAGGSTTSQSFFANLRNSTVSLARQKRGREDNAAEPSARVVPMPLQPILTTNVLRRLRSTA